MIKNRDFFRWIKLFLPESCLGYGKEVAGLKKISFIQWVVRLIGRDMEAFREDAKDRQKIYDYVRKRLKR